MRLMIKEPFCDNDKCHLNKYLADINESRITVRKYYDLTNYEDIEVARYSYYHPITNKKIKLWGSCHNAIQLYITGIK